MPLSNTTETEVGYVDTPGCKIKVRIVRDARGGQEVRLNLIDSDGRVSAALAVLSRQKFGELKELIAATDEQLAKVPVICRNCKTPIHSDTAFAESRGPCPFCGKVPTRF